MCSGVNKDAGYECVAKEERISDDSRHCISKDDQERRTEVD